MAGIYVGVPIDDFIVSNEYGESIQFTLDLCGLLDGEGEDYPNGCIPELTLGVIGNTRASVTVQMEPALLRELAEFLLRNADNIEQGNVPGLDE